MAIHLGRRLPAASSNLPDEPSEANRPGSLGLRPNPGHPIWSCTGWGLPCHSCRQECGELLPRHFTLTGNPGFRPDLRSRLARDPSFPAVYFLWHFPSRFRVWPLASILSCGARTFLRRFPAFALTPSGHQTHFPRIGSVQSNKRCPPARPSAGLNPPRRPG